MIPRLSIAQVINIHDHLIEMFGGTQGLRDLGSLDSALSSPFQTFDGKRLYPDPISRAAKLCTGIILDHPFLDGNKRTGVMVMLIYLELEGLEVSFTDAELVELGMGIARGSLKKDRLQSKIENAIIRK